MDININKYIQGRVIVFFVSFVLVQILSFGADENDSVRSSLSGMTSANGVIAYNLNANSGIRSSDVFQKHLVFKNPVRWSRSLPGSVNSDAVLQSPQWQAVRKDIERIWGNNIQTDRFIARQELLVDRAIAVNNKAGAIVNAANGDATEQLMEAFYAKDGWERIPSKLGNGNQGIDGIFVQRRPNGAFSKLLFVESKAGSSRLGMTRSGEQLSDSWINNDISKLLNQSKQEYINNPSIKLRQQILDIDNIDKMTPFARRELFRKNIVCKDGNPYLKIQPERVIGSVGGKLQTIPSTPMIIDMSAKNLAPKMALMKDTYYDGKKATFINRGLNKAEANSNVAAIQRAFEKRKITSDSELYGFIRKNVFDKIKGNKICADLGEVPAKVSLAGLRPYAFQTGQGVVYSAAIAAGISILCDALNNNLSLNTVKVSVLSAGVGGGMYLAQEGVIRSADWALKTNAGQKILGQELAKTFGKNIGRSLPIVFGAVTIGITFYQWKQGNISDSDALVYSSGAIAGTAVALFFSCTATGSAIGSACPGVGTAIGIVIGVGVGAYAYWRENQRYAFRKEEVYIRATIDTEQRRKGIEERISFLTSEANKLDADVWKIFNSAKQLH